MKQEEVFKFSSTVDMVNATYFNLANHTHLLKHTDFNIY